MTSMTQELIQITMSANESTSLKLLKKKYLIVPLNSLKIDGKKVLPNTLRDALPLTSNMVYDSESPGTFVIYSMEEMKEVGRTETDPFFIVHTINAYDDVDENGNEKIVIDTTNMGDGSIIDTYYYSVRSLQSDIV